MHGDRVKDIQARLAAGDSEALEMIWNLYASDLLGYLVSLLCSLHEAEDALQDVFVTIARKRATVAKARLLKPYIFRLARNVGLNRLKASRRIKEKLAEPPSWLAPTDQAVSDSGERELLAAALSKLPIKQREVIMLKFYREKTFKEIAELLGVSENTTASRYRYGIATLKKHVTRTS